MPKARKMLKPKPGSKTAVLLGLLKRWPNASGKELFKRMLAMGVKTSLASVRTRMGHLSRGGLVPYAGRPGKHVVLGSRKEKIMRAIFYNPKKSNKQIHAMLKEDGTEVPQQKISDTRGEMRAMGMDVSKGIRAPRYAVLSLTPEQEALVPDVKKLIWAAVWREQAVAGNWPLQAKQEFADFANFRAAHILKGFDPEKGKLSVWVFGALPNLVHQFRKEQLVQGMAITPKQADLLKSLLGMRNRGMSTKAIAEKAGIPAGEVEAWLEAHERYEKTRRGSVSGSGVADRKGRGKR